MRLLACISSILFTTLLLMQVTVASAAVTFIGEGSIPGTARDQSGLDGLLEDGVTPRDLAGGFGSAIAYTGKDNLYIATPDRGPADGTTSYVDRFYTISIDVARIGTNRYAVTSRIEQTRLMRADGKSYFTGSFAAFDDTGSPQESLRFDPEGVRVGACGRTAFVSDEYGPYLYEFDLDSGKRLRSLALPNKFLIDYPAVVPNDELSRNSSGRQANRGMEGLAISPDGGKLYGIMQSALIQDGGLNASLSRVGTNNRIVEIDVSTGDVREFLYTLDDKGNGVSEIVAVNDHQFLVLERDGRAGAAAAFKKLFLIDIAGATDIRAQKQLPSTGVPAGVTAVAKAPFIDMLNPAYGLAGATFPEKLEGLAFGPDLDDGRHLLIVTNDNDFNPAQASRFFAFAIDQGDLDYVPQAIDGQGGPKCKASDAR
jgi:Esterase-like activity of phytase